MHFSDLKKERRSPVISPINDEINELRARLEKLGVRNTEAAQLTLIFPFNIEI